MNLQRSLVKNVIVVRDLGGNSSTGIEVLKLYRYLKENTSDFLFITAYSEVKDTEVIVIPPRYNWVPALIQKIVLILFGIDLYACAKSLNWQSMGYDLRGAQLFGITSSSDFYVLRMVKKMRNYKWRFFVDTKMHFFDPIPAKAHWGEHYFLRRAKQKLTAQFLKGTTCNTTASKAMSEYMAKMYNLSFGVVYSNINTWSFAPKSKTRIQKKKAFYLGTIYGKRNARPLLEYFSNQEEWEFHIYGSSGKEGFNKNIIYHGFVSNLEVLESPDLLIDLDIDEEDVYIPGKSYTYLGSNVPILVISPANSGLRSFYGMNEIDNEMLVESRAGIFACQNEVREIELAMDNLENFLKAQYIIRRDTLIDGIKQNYLGRNF